MRGSRAVCVAHLIHRAPRNATVVAALLVCALSVAGAILLILELDKPFQGIMQVSGAPLREALSRLGE